MDEATRRLFFVESPLAVRPLARRKDFRAAYLESERSGQLAARAGELNSI